MKTEMLAKKLDDCAVQCLACNRYCKIPNDHAGYCGVRVNDNGQLKLSVYGKPCAAWSDPIEKKPLFHFLPGSRSYSIGTFGCNFSCVFCQNYDISQAPQEARQKDPKTWKEYFQRLLERCKKLPPEKVVENAVADNCKSISFTYNEPTIFTEYALDTMKIAKKQGLYGVYVTNGYTSKECLDAMKGLIDAVNIDLKAYNQKFYTELCKVPSLDPVKESIKYAKKLGIWAEVTTLLIPKWNDDLNELKQEAEWLASVDMEMPWHVTAFYPAYKMTDASPTPPATLIKARELGKDAGLKHVYCGNVSSSYSDYETTFCSKCNKELITRSGFSIMNNNIINGKCKFCKTTIAGVWE